MAHQIIDNRSKKLVDEIHLQLNETLKAKIAVGYFFISGLTVIEEQLRKKNNDGSYQIKEVRLLIGNTTNRQTIEELAQGYRLYDKIEKELEKLQRPGTAEKRIERQQAVSEVR
ncbi:hypothetical protein KJ656_14635, partial [bacterium]|nr:hypothetical protein [bacterium]